MKSAVRSLIVANVAVFAAQLLLDHEWVNSKFALWPLGAGFEPWQLVTSAFLHSTENFGHIVLNMYGLWAFGSMVERALGPRRFLWVYFASVLTSGIVQLLYATATVDSQVVSTVGASGGVFGVLLAFGMLFPHSRVMLLIPPIPMKAWVMVFIFGLIELVTGVTGTLQGVAHFAHLGGMLGALVLMLAWRGSLPPAPRDATPRSLGAP